MKSMIVILVTMVVFGYGGEDDDMYDWDNLTKELQIAFSYKGNWCISMGRRIRQSWRLGCNNLCNADYALGTKEAEFFFYGEQKIRDETYKQLVKWRQEGSVSTFRRMKAVQKYATGQSN